MTMFQSYKPTPKSPDERRGMLPTLEQIDRRRRFRYKEMMAQGGWRIRVVFYLVLAVILVIVAAPSAEAYAYSQLQTSFETQQCSPVISADVQSVASTISDRFKGDLLAAAANIVTGVDVKGVVTMSNPSFVPLYIPSASHRVAIEGKESKFLAWTGAMWIAPNNRKSEVISLRVGINELPETVLRNLANGGTVRIAIISEVPLGPFTARKTTGVVASISEPLSSYMK